MDSVNAERDWIHSLKRVMPAPLRRGLHRARRAASYPLRQVVGTITHVKTGERAVALTFDDGPHPLTTPRFLDALEAHGARGTFFLLGRSIERYPEIVARIRAGGHAVGNHSFDHRSLPSMSARERRTQIEACGRALGEVPLRLFRPPYGDQTLLSRLDALRLGWEVVTWSITGDDWRNDTAEIIADGILQRLRPGSIVLLHDVLFHYEDVRYASRESALGAVTRILAAASGAYRFVTLPELLRLGRPQRELWIKPSQPDYLATLKSGETQ